MRQAALGSTWEAAARRSKRPRPLARSVDAAANARRISGLALRCKARSKRTGSRAGGCRGLPVLAAGLPVAPAITLALLAQPILVEARGAQLFAHFLARLSLAHLAIPSAITLTLLAQSILVFTGEPHLLALAAAAAAAAIIYADTAGADLNGRLRLRIGWVKSCAPGEDNRCGADQWTAANGREGPRLGAR